jgi:Tfp pilus assembly protein PilF
MVSPRGDVWPAPGYDLKYMTGRRFSLVLCISLVCMLARKVTEAQSPAARDSDRALASAQEAYDHGNPEKAVAALADYLRVDPENFDANELMGLSLVAEQRFGDAKGFLAAAVKVNPRSALALANLATDLAELNEADAAEIQFKKALALDPNGVELNHNFGEFYAAREKMKEAIPLLRKAQQLRPTYNNGYDLAVAETDDGELDAAENDVRTLLRQQKAAELHTLLGTILEKKRSFIAAGNEFQQAALIDPSEDNLVNWGAELLRHRTLEPAAQVFGKGIERFPKSWRLQVGLGVSEYLLGHQKEAVDAFCAAIDVNPKNTQPYYFLSRVHGVPAEQESAVSSRFEEYVKNAPKDPKAPFYYAMNLWDSDNGQAEGTDMAKVKSLLQQAILLDPRFAEAHLQLGILYEKESNQQLALSEFEHAVALDASLSIAHFRLGHALIRSGDLKRGRRELEEGETLKTQEEDKIQHKQQEILQFLYNPSK